MKLIEIIWQHRNDFSGILECEHCGNKQELNSGYHDHYYHSIVIPGICCKECGKNRAGKITGKNAITHISENDL